MEDINYAPEALREVEKVEAPWDVPFEYKEDLHDRPSNPKPRPPNLTADSAKSALRKEDFGNAQSKMWSLYMERARKEDQDLTESITVDTTGVLTFTGLFASVVASFLIESYKTLQQDSGDTTVFLLAQISQQLAPASNSTGADTPSSSPTPEPVSFRPSSSALRINIFWFLSLALSLTCALTATLMQQWARRYTQNTRIADNAAAGPSPTRGRIHAYLFAGSKTFHVKSMVEALPALLHASVILFFAGLLEFLFSINDTVAYTILTFLVVIAMVYLGLTALPLRYPNSPYATPLSTPLHRLFTRFASIRQARYLPPLSANGKFSYALARARSFLQSWRNATRNTRLRQLEAAALRNEAAHLEALRWTSAVVLYDDAALRYYLNCLLGYAGPADQTSTKLVTAILETPEFTTRAFETLNNMASVFENSVGNYASFNDVAHSSAALDYLRFARGLALTPNSTLVPFLLWFLRPMLPRIHDLRASANADIAISATCTGAVIAAFLLQDMVSDKTSIALWDVPLRTWTYQLLDIDMDGLRPADPHAARLVARCAKTLNIAAVVRRILPHLQTASPSTLRLVWSTLPTLLTGIMDVHVSSLVPRGHDLRADILYAADPLALAELAVSTVSVDDMHSPYSRLYNILHPLYEWLQEHPPPLEPNTVSVPARLGSRCRISDIGNAVALASERHPSSRSILTVADFGTSDAHVTELMQSMNTLVIQAETNGAIDALLHGKVVFFARVLLQPASAGFNRNLPRLRSNLLDLLVFIRENRDTPVISTVWPKVFLPLLPSLQELRGDPDPDLALTASCAMANMVIFLENVVRGLPWEHSNPRPSIEELSAADKDFTSCIVRLVRVSDPRLGVLGSTGQSQSIKHRYWVGGACNIWVFVRNILPHMRAAEDADILLPAPDRLIPTVWRTLSSLLEALPKRGELLIRHSIWEKMGVRTHLEALSNEVRYAADERGRQELGDVLGGEELPIASAKDSVYTQLYDRLHPLRDALRDAADEFVNNPPVTLPQGPEGMPEAEIGFTARSSTPILTTRRELASTLT